MGRRDKAMRRGDDEIFFLFRIRFTSRKQQNSSSRVDDEKLFELDLWYENGEMFTTSSLTAQNASTIYVLSFFFPLSLKSLCSRQHNMRWEMRVSFTGLSRALEEVLVCNRVLRDFMLLERGLLWAEIFVLLCVLFISISVNSMRMHRNKP